VQDLGNLSHRLTVNNVQQGMDTPNQPHMPSHIGSLKLIKNGLA
jgi:hypothetical protein